MLALGICLVLCWGSRWSYIRAISILEAIWTLCVSTNWSDCRVVHRGTAHQCRVAVTVTLAFISHLGLHMPPMWGIWIFSNRGLFRCYIKLNINLRKCNTKWWLYQVISPSKFALTFCGVLSHWHINTQCNHLLKGISHCSSGPGWGWISNRGDRKSVTPELAHSKNNCTRTDTVFLPLIQLQKRVLFPLGPTTQTPVHSF